MAASTKLDDFVIQRRAMANSNSRTMILALVSSFEIKCA